MTKHERLTLAGTSHWSARGDLESDMWIWWIEVEGVKITDEEMHAHALRKTQGSDFIHELLPHLPAFLLQKPNRYLSAPDCVPGGHWDMMLPLSECPDPSAAERVIEKYFPNLYSLA